MNNAKARFILRSYRSDGSDAQDPVFREPLHQAGRDPELKAWFESERKTDDAIRRKLDSVDAPSDLLDDLLAVTSVSAHRSFWRRTAKTWLAAAAVLILSLGGAYWFLPPAQPALAFTAYPEAVSGFLHRPFALDYKATSLQEADLWLRRNFDRSAPTPPPHLQAAALDGVGCKMFNWQGEDVLLLCFFLDDGRIAHYFIMEADQLPDTPGSPTAPQWAQQGRYATGVWSDGRHAYVLAMDGGIDELQTLL